MSEAASWSQTNFPRGVSYQTLQRGPGGRSAPARVVSAAEREGLLQRAHVSDDGGGRAEQRERERRAAGLAQPERRLLLSRSEMRSVRAASFLDPTYLAQPERQLRLSC